MLHRTFKHIKICVRNAFLSVATPPVLWCLGGLSRKRAASLARMSAGIVSFFGRKSFRTALANLAIAFPEKTDEERRALAKRSLANVMLTGLEVIRLLKHPTELKSMMREPSKDLLEMCIGKAAIMCLPHLGNWEVFGQAAPLFGIDSAAVAEPLGNKKLNDLLVAAREQNGLKIIPRVGAARKVLHALHQKQTVGLLVDQNVSPRDGGIFANFFGLPVTMSPLPAVLARKLQIPIIVTASVRMDDGTFALVCRKLPKDISEYVVDGELSQDVLKLFEELIREYPEQYTWLYHRWQYIPANASEALEKAYPPYAKRRPYEATPRVLAAAEAALKQPNQSTEKK